MKKTIWVILFLLSIGQITKAQGWDKTYTSPLGDTTQAFSAVETYDGGYVFAGNTVNYQAFSYRYRLLVTKTDKQGAVIWQYNPADLFVADSTMKVFQTIDSSLILVLTDESAQQYLTSRILILKLNKNGVEQSRKRYLAAGNFLQSADITAELDRIVLTTYEYTQSNGIAGCNVLQLSANGDSLNNQLFKSGLLTNVAFGGDRKVYARIAKRIPTIEYGIVQFNLNGDSIWYKKLYYNDVLKRANDGKILVNSHLKLDSDGRVIFNGNPRFDRLDFYGPSEPVANQVFTQRKGDKSIYGLTNFNPITTERFKNLFFVKKDSIGRRVESFQFITNGIDLQGFAYSAFSDMIPTSDGGFLLVGSTYGFSRKVRLLKLLANQTLTGKVYADSIENCRFDATEKGFAERIISVVKTNDTRWAITDAQGNYETQMDTGTYTIKPILPNSNWLACTPSVTKQLSGGGVTDTVNFAVQAAYYCPQMQVNAGTWGLRRCFENTYSVNYANNGTAIAQNAYVEITLDSLMEFRGAEIPLSSRVGQRLRFNIGNVNFGSSGRFDMVIYVKCGDSTRLNQTLCLESHVFPDTVCVPTPNWNGANIVVTGTCARDSVEFLIRNTGNAPTGNLRRIIIEDQVMLFNQQISLPANASTIYRTPANGSTWRMTVQQVPNNPYSTFATAFVEGCRMNATTPFSTGNVTTFPEADGNVAIDIQCLAIRGSFDPNDKTGYPTGTGTSRLIGQNTDLEYLLRFQNTGSDTAFTVVLRDTLPPQLDISSIETGASSHPYTWNLEGKGVLSFTFNNIRLVDFRTNEPKSHGFVKFRIKQKNDLPFGTKIENQAGIYFDFNAPVITNRTLHTVGKDILAIVERIYDDKVQIKVFPNPFSNTTTFEIDPSVSEGIFEIFDLNGKVLRREKFENNRFEFQRRDLRTGIFIFKISTTDGRLIGNGKIVAQ